MEMILDPKTTLTPRQLELLALYASGHEIKQIAEIKFLSYQTVQKALSAAKERVGARTLAHLCALATETGVIARNSNGGYVPVQEERVVGE